MGERFARAFIDELAKLGMFGPTPPGQSPTAMLPTGKPLRPATPPLPAVGQTPMFFGNASQPL